MLSPGASADAMVSSLEDLEEQLSEEFAALTARLYSAAANPSEASQSVAAMHAGRACYQCGREFFAGERAYEHLGLKVCKQCARNLKIA
jgi:hypothetical protein